MLYLPSLLGLVSFFGRSFVFFLQDCYGSFFTPLKQPLKNRILGPLVLSINYVIKAKCLFCITERGGVSERPQTILHNELITILCLLSPFSRPLSAGQRLSESKNIDCLIVLPTWLNTILGLSLFYFIQGVQKIFASIFA